MSTRSSLSQPSSSPSPPDKKASPPEIAVVAYRSLEVALTKEYRRRYNDGVVLRFTEETRDDAPRMHLKINDRELPDLPVELVVTHLGDTTYEVLCAVERGDTQRFTYSVPQRTGTRVSHAPYLGENLATFLLEELEKHLGRLVLDGGQNPKIAV